MADPSLAHLIHQLPGPVVEQNIWKPKRGFSPQTLPEDFLSRAEKPDIRTGALCIGPISLKEAENMGLSRIIMQEDHCCWRLLKYPLIVAQVCRFVTSYTPSVNSVGHSGQITGCFV